MMQSLNTAAAGMVAQQSNLDVISNNLANVNTTGFKGQKAKFADLIYQTIQAATPAATGSSYTPNTSQIGLGATFSATSTNFAQGALTPTGNPLDLAIQGSGFFQVQLPGSGSSAVGYTRDGSFTVDSNGLLVTTDGYPVLPEVTIPSGASSVTVSNTGVVSAVLAGQSDVSQVGQIDVAMFANPGALERMGQNIYIASSAAGSVQLGKPGDASTGGGTISSGYTESSNVQVVQEMVNMIMAQRAYEMNSKAVQTSDQMLQTVAGLIR
jgi:flagellar basal-body rod protein FlgG